MWSKVAENLGVRHAKRLMAFGSFKRSARQPNELDIPTSGDPASESAADASMAKPPPVPVPDPVPASPAVTGAVGPTFTEVEPQVTGDPVTGDSEDIPLASPVFEGFTSASAVIAGDVAPEVSILAVVAEAVVAGGVIPEVAIPTEVVKVAPQPQAEPRALIPFTPIVMDDGRVKQMAKDADAKMAEGMRLPVESRALYQSLAAEADQKPQSLARVLPQIQRIEAQEARIAELERLLGTATRQHQSETASLQEEIITLQGSLNVLSTAVSRLEKELAVAKQEKATATRQVYSLERELELLKLDKEESDSARARAEKRAGDSDSQIEACGGSQHGGGMRIVPYDEGAGSQHRAVLPLLHGSLEICVHHAYSLPKTKGWRSITPFVTIQVSNTTVARTYVVSNNEKPVWEWEQHFLVPVCHEAAEVQFVVKYDFVSDVKYDFVSDFVSDKSIGLVAIPADKEFLSGKRIMGLYPLLESNGKQCAPDAALRLSIQFIPVARHTTYYNVPDCYPVPDPDPDTYFPLRRGMRVTLYQDVHVPDRCLPDIWLDHELRYQHEQCWRDIYDAIRQARKLIYIAGWSVFHTIQLVRDGAQVPSLGDLLKQKAGEGVRVLLLVWKDPTSRRILGRQMEFMDTRGEETHRFFKDSPVRVLHCPRSAGKRHSWVETLSFRGYQETGIIFSHHQKTVIVDADAGPDKRKIIAFVGGLDLCGGRYDTPLHPLFRTLQTVHKEDYYNPNFATVDPRGPREPWHDLHSKIDGPAAYDVLQNFKERWLKASKHHDKNMSRKSYDDALLSIEGIQDIIGIDDAIYVNDNDPGTWHVQVFRSIDSNSAKGFPKDPREAKNLVCGKKVLIDMSIHTAYVRAIRAAQHFIYIENQYFIGSSFNWDSNKDLGANNLIPIEIARKIVNKIKAKERFSAYIVIPMWPEGNPTGAPSQRILYWQNKTMKMMYTTIYMALKEEGLDDEPQDYLNFFCLGNREEVLDSSDTSNVSNTANNPQEQARKNRRFMVYVHSKGMIVDDEYVIIGSANINQRSMEGTRDTEIAIGAYQPQYTWKNKGSAPRGQIYGYRMSLWAEHIGHVEEAFDQPESLECVRRVRRLGEENWRRFIDDKVTEMTGHLMKYPVSVDREVKVEQLPECPTFPDLGGSICGSFLAIQENLTI